MLTAKSLSTIFDEWCGTPISKEAEQEIIDKYGFLLRVVVTKDIPPRHSIFSWIRGMGVNKYDEIFEGDTMRLPDEWLLAFPERMCSLEEQMGLIHKLVKINNAMGRPMTQLDILTQSPQIISDCMSSAVNIISFPDGKKTYNQDYM